MNKLNKFFRKLYSSPSMMFAAGAGIIFLCFSLAIFFMPSLTAGYGDSWRLMLGGIMLLYALFRLYSFYVQYKKYDDE